MRTTSHDTFETQSNGTDRTTTNALIAGAAGFGGSGSADGASRLHAGDAAVAPGRRRRAIWLPRFC